MCIVVLYGGVWFYRQQALFNVLVAYSMYNPVSTKCTVEHSVLRVREIYALENAVFCIAVYGPYKP